MEGWGTLSDACAEGLNTSDIASVGKQADEELTREQIEYARSNPVGEERLGPARLGMPRLTKFELARVISTRASQLANNDPPRCDVGQETDPVYIAQMEYSKGVLPPYEVRRYHHDGTWERWTLAELCSS